ncbi:MULTISPECIES: chaplin [Streptomyces]
MKKTAAVVAGVIMALGMASPAFADGGADADGVAVGSPGVLSGNVVQVPINAQINVCGNSINLVGLLNPASGNVCVND